MKKTLAILLSLALVICMIPGTAFATVDAEATQPVKTKLTADIVELSAASVVYNGTAQEPTITIKGVEGVVKDTDYTVTWDKTVNGVGTYTATIAAVGTSEKLETGDSNVTKTFTVNALNLATANISTTSDLLSSDFNASNQITETGIAKITAKVGEIDLKGANLTDEVTITYTYAAANGNTPASVTVEVKPTNVNDTNIINSRVVSLPVKIDLSNATIALARNTETFTYNGAAQVPYYGVVVKVGETTIPATGYTVTYSNNVNGGTYAHATITGTGIYSGTKTVSNVFYINPKAITSYGISAEVSTGTPTTPPTVVVKDGSTVLSSNDYSVSFSGNVATITGRGNYTGTITKNFTLVDKTITTATPAAGVTYYYSGYVQEPYLTVKGSDNKTLTQNYDYKITYTDAQGKAVTPVNAGTYNYTVIGMGQYAGVVSGTFTIAPFPKDWVEVTATAGYTASTPYVSVRSFDGKINFVQDKDYKVLSTYVSTYNNKVNVYISTMGNIESGSLTAEYALVAKPITSCTVAFTNGRSSSAYTGTAISAPITVRDGYTTLAQGTHYSVTYKNSLGQTVSSIRDAGTYTIEITGKGMYSGTTYLTYTVYGIDISYYTVTLKESSVQATGYSKVPTIASVKYGTTTLSSSNYTVTYKNSLGQTVTSMSAPDTYTVVVTGKNGYQGSTTATFRIVGLEQEVTIANGTSKKVYADSDAFQINAKASGDGTGFVWTTSDPTVATVSATGKVTIVGVGRAKITATTIGTKKYDPASGSFIVKVYPDKVKQTTKPWTDGKKGQLKVRWGYQDGVTKYQIRYSTTSSFKSYTTKTVNAHGDSTLATQSTTLNNLKSGKKYYIKVRAVYQMYNEEGTKITYYGAWSPWKSGTTK